MLVDRSYSLVDLFVSAICNSFHIVLYLPFRKPLLKALSMSDFSVILVVILELLVEDLVFFVECIVRLNVGALVNKTLANECFRLDDIVQILSPHDALIRNVLNHRRPSAHASEHGFVEASAVLLVNEIQQFEIAGCGSGQARVSTPDGLCVRPFGRILLQLNLEHYLLLFLMKIGTHLYNFRVEQACEGLVLS